MCYRPRRSDPPSVAILGRNTFLRNSTFIALRGILALRPMKCLSFTSPMLGSIFPLFFLPLGLLAQQSQELLTAHDRPKIGVALEGGGALGLAHIGVLEWFEEHRIPVDYIAGTSMGGLVGGLYATGANRDRSFCKGSVVARSAITTRAFPSSSCCPR